MSGGNRRRSLVDVRLQALSPCIDSGKNAFFLVSVLGDLAGNPRFFDDPIAPNLGLGTPPILDMGVFERGSNAVIAYGQGLAGCNGSHVLSNSGAPYVGNESFRLICTNAPANSLGLGLISDVADYSGSDPFGIGIVFYVDLVSAAEILTLDVFSDGSGVADFTVPVPNNPVLAGRTFYVQFIWAWIAPCTPSLLGLSTSNGVQIMISN